MDLKKILKDYGLSEKEASLYLSCLELGSASVYKIAKKAGLPRSTCYEILEDLKEKKLVSTYKQKKVIYYNAENPKEIIEQTKDKIKTLEDALPEFNAIYASAKNKPSVRFYQGKEGMKIILKEILAQAKEIKSFSSADDLFDVLGDYWPDFLKQRIKAKIPARIILVDSKKARERRERGPKELRETRIVSEKYTHHGLIIIWRDKIAKFSFKKELVALVIESKELAQTQEMMFNFIWDSVEK